MSDYEDKKQARIDRYRARAEQARAQSTELYQQSHDMISVIPMGQPICQRQCNFVVFRRTENVEKWRVKVYSHCIIILAVFVRQA